MKLSLEQHLVPKEKRLPETLLLSIEKHVTESLKQVPEGELSIAFVDDAEIQRLNRMYRQKDKVTDVLSFSYLDDPFQKESIGDVVISYAQAERQAEKGDIELECVDLIVHGILHVLGYDHETPEDAEEMFPLQDSIVAKVL